MTRHETGACTKCSLWHIFFSSSLSVYTWTAKERDNAKKAALKTVILKKTLRRPDSQALCTPSDQAFVVLPGGCTARGNAALGRHFHLCGAFSFSMPITGANYQQCSKKSVKCKVLLWYLNEKNLLDRVLSSRLSREGIYPQQMLDIHFDNITANRTPDSQRSQVLQVWAQHFLHAMGCNLVNGPRLAKLYQHIYTSEDSGSKGNRISKKCIPIYYQKIYLVSIQTSTQYK